ncbi:MAG: histidinol-phosphate transaminase [Clostridia bacterium]
MIQPRPEILNLPPYHPGRPSGVAAVINLAANENAWGPSPAVADALRRWDGVARYPDMDGSVLKHQLAAVWKLPEDTVLLGTGSGHLIKCLAETYLRPGDGVVTVFPTFSLYRQGTQLMGGRLLPLAGDGHHVDFSALPAWVEAAKPRMVFLCSPNNPTGDLASAAVIEQTLTALGPDGLLVVDEAYIDFATRAPDLARWVGRRPPLVLLRTLSKAYGLAGLRIGALIADPAVVEAVSRVREPFPVSVPALWMGAAAVSDQTHRSQVVTAVTEGRHQLENALMQRGWNVNPSEANFVWAAPPRAVVAAHLPAQLAVRGVLVRQGDNFGVPDHLRITVGTPTEIDTLLSVLDSITATAPITQE